MMPLTSGYRTPEERQADALAAQEAAQAEQARIQRLKSIGESNTKQKETGVTGNNLGREWSKYDEGQTYYQGANEDYKARKQSTGEAFANSLVANTGKFVLRAIDGATFAGTGAYGLVAGLMQGEVDSFSKGVEAVFDNPISQKLREMEKQLTAALPIYQTQAQNESIDVLSMGFVDKILDGVAYVGAMGTGIGALGKVGKFGAKQIGRFMGKALDEGHDLNYVKNLLSDTAELSKVVNGGGVGKSGNGLRDLFVDAYGGVVESAAEASQTREEVYNTLKAQKLAETGKTQLSEQEEADISQSAATAGAANFGLNLITTTFANKEIYRNLYSNGWKNEMVSFNKVFKEGDQFKIKGVDSKISTYKKLMGGMVGDAAKGAITEGAQELSQFASNDFIVNLMTNPSQEGVSNWAKTFEAGQETLSNLGSKDAMESALIGGIIGGGFGAYTGKAEREGKATATQKAVADANNNKVGNVLNTVAKSSEITKAKDGAVAIGDRLGYETLKKAEVFNLVNSRIEIDQYQDLVTDLEQDKELDLTSFKEKYSIADKNYSEADQKKTIDYTLNSAKEIKASRDSIMSNYGHKITAMQQEFPKMLETLTLVDTLRKDASTRETELIDKLTPVLDYRDMQSRVLTPERETQFKLDIKSKESEISALRESVAGDPAQIVATGPQIQQKMNELVTLQVQLANSVTEANYKDLVGLKGADADLLFQQQKKAKDSTHFREYQRDIKDLLAIQEMKEDYINMFSQLVNNEDYNKKVQQQIGMANQSKLLDGMFSLSGNIETNVTPRVDKDGNPVKKFGKQIEDVDSKFVAGAAGEVQEYIKPGDLYQLNTTMVRKAAKDSPKKWENFEAYTAWEVTDTSVKMVGQTPTGVIKVKNAFGDKLELSPNEFKQMIRPVMTGNGEFKINKNKGDADYQFYEAYKDRAIQYELNGEVITGMLGIYGNFSLKLKYYDKDGKLQNTDFLPSKFYNGKKQGYLKVLSEKDTLEYQLKANLDGIVKFLTVTISNKEASMTKAYNRLNQIQEFNLDSKDFTTSYGKLIDKYKKIIDEIDGEIKVNQEALARINSFKNMPLEPDESFGPEVNAAIDKLLAYKKAALANSNNKNAEGLTPKKVKDEAVVALYKAKVAGTDATVSELERSLREIKKSFIQAIGGLTENAQVQEALLDDSDTAEPIDVKYALALSQAEELKVDEIVLNSGATSVNATTQTIDALADTVVAETAKMSKAIKDLNDDYTDQILNIANIDRTSYEAMRAAELTAVTKFAMFLRKRGFFKSKPNDKSWIKPHITDNTDANYTSDGLTRRPLYVSKTVGNSISEDIPSKKAFYDNIQNIDADEVSLKTIPSSEWPSYGLNKFDPKTDIFAVVVDKKGKIVGGDKKPMVVTLPTILLKDNYGFRFRNVEEGNEQAKKDYTDKYNDKLKTAIDGQEDFAKVREVIAEIKKEAGKQKDPELKAFLNDTANYVEEHANMREAVLSNPEGVTLNVTGKSNGIAKTEGNFVPLKKLLIKLNTGSLKVAITPTISMGSGKNAQEFKVREGAVYYVDEGKNLLVPVFTRPIGNAKFEFGSATDKVSKSFVDNIIDGMKFLQAAKAGTATFAGGEKAITLDKAYDYFNRTLNTFIYTQREDKTKDTYTRFYVDDNGFATAEFTDKGAQVIVNLESDAEVEILKDYLSRRLFNIDATALDPDVEVYFNNFYEQDGKMVAFSNKFKNYESKFALKFFGIETNLSPHPSGRYFENGYLTTGNIIKTTKAAKETPATTTSTDPDEAGGTMTRYKGPVQAVPVPGAVNTPAAATPAAPQIPAPIAGAKVRGMGKKVAGVPEQLSMAELNAQLAAAKAAASNVSSQQATAAANTGLNQQTRKGRKKLLANRVQGKLMSQSEYDAAKKLFTEKYGVPYYIIHGLVENDAYGMVMEKAEVLLSDQAVAGTEYHEEFHVVSQHLMDTTELYEVYEEWKNVNNSKADYNTVEEELAEEYRIYRQGFKGVVGKIKSFFEKLTSRIKSLLGTRTRKEELFSDIRRGKYYGYPIKSSLTSYKYKAIVDLDARAVNDFMERASFKFINKLIEEGRDFAIEDLNESAETELSQEEEDQLYLTTRSKIVTDKLYRTDLLNTVIVVDENVNGEVVEKEVRLLDFIINQSMIESYTLDNALDSEITSYAASSAEKAKLLRQEYRDYLRKKFGLANLEEEEVDENTTGRDIVKKGDNEIDFFKEAIGQMNLLLAGYADNTNGKSIKSSTFSKILFDNLLNISDSKSFFDKLGNIDLQAIADNPKFGESYALALQDILGNYLAIEADTNTNENIDLQSLFFRLFSKSENIYQVLKVEEENLQIKLKVVNQSTYKAKEDVRKRLESAVAYNWEAAKAESRSSAMKIAVLLDIDIAQVQASKKTDTLAKALSKSTTPQAFLGKVKGDINAVIDILEKATPLERLFSITNAKSKPQFSIQNFSSLHKEFQDYQAREQFPLFSELVVLNGIQKNLADADIAQETTNQLKELDLHAYYYYMFTADRQLPFVFSGDKSMVNGFKLAKGQLTEDQFYQNENYFYDQFQTAFADEMDNYKNMLSLQGIIKGVKPSMQLFSFLEGTPIYERLTYYAENERLEEFIDEDIFEDVFKATKNKIDELASELRQLMQEEDIAVQDNVEHYIASYMLGMHEQKKLIGEFTYYSDLAKRAYAWGSAKANVRTDEKFLEFYNKRHPSSNPIQSDIRTLVLDDVYVEGGFNIDPETGKYAGAYPDEKGNKRGTNVADAQGYITLNAARYLLDASGMLSSSLRKVFNMIETLDSKTTITNKELKEFNEATAKIDEQISVLKPQYFGYQEVAGSKVPTFYKFSVLPLSKLLTNGKNLDAIRQAMENNKLDLVVFDSANKVGRKVPGKGVSTKLYDENDEWIFNPNADYSSVMQSTPWAGMGIQVEMPKHHETTTFGTQFRKLFTVDLADKTLINKHEQLLKDKTKKEEDKMKTRLGLDDNYNPIDGNTDKLLEEIRRLATLRDVPQAFMQDLYRLDGSYDIISNKAKLQSIVNSLVEKSVIRQKMTGDSKAMVSSVGFEKAGGNIKKSTRLKFYESKNSNTGMEVYLPMTMMNRYKNLVTWNEELQLFEPKLSAIEKYPYLFKAVGYRIPTQSQASIDLITIKGFLPEKYGNAIVVPAEITSKTGADFDIDKLNLFFAKGKEIYTEGVLKKTLKNLDDSLFDFEKDRLEYYNTNIKDVLYEELTDNQKDIVDYLKKELDPTEIYDKESVDNKLFEFYVDTLASPEYFDYYVKSLDNTTLLDIATDIEKAIGINKTKSYFNFFNPLYSVKRRMSFMSAKYTLGAVALATTHHAETQKHNIGITSNVKGLALKLGDYSLGTLLSKFDSRLGKDSIISLSRVYDLDETQKISDTLSDFVSACVDAAKNDYIVSTNFDLETVSVAMLMIRTGIPAKTVLNFLSQPGIREYTNALRNTKSLVRYSTKKYNVKEAYKANLNQGFKVSNMENTLNESTKSQNQQQYIALYQELSEYGQLLADLQQSTSFDTKGTGRTLEENEMAIEMYKARKPTFDKFISNFANMTDPAKSFNAEFREIVFKANNLNTLLFAANNSKLGTSYENKLKEYYTSKESADVKTYKAGKFKNYFLTYMLQKGATRLMKSSLPKMIADVAEFKKTSTNQFLQALTSTDENTTLSLVRGADMKGEEMDVLTSAFLELYQTDREIADKVILSGLYMSGVVNSPLTYMNIIPSWTVLKTLELDASNPFMSAYDRMIKAGGTLDKAVGTASAQVDKELPLQKRTLVALNKADIVAAPLENTWDNYSEKILAKHPEYTKSKFNKLSVAGKNNFINCL